MNGRIKLATLGLTLTLAACGQSTQTASTPAAQASGDEVTAARPAPADKLIAVDSARAIPGQYIVVMQKGALSGTLGTQSLGKQSLGAQAAQIVSALGLDA